MEMKEFGPWGGRVPGAPPWIRQCLTQHSTFSTIEKPYLAIIASNAGEKPRRKNNTTGVNLRPTFNQLKLKLKAVV